MNFPLLRHNQEAALDRLRQQKYYDNVFIAPTHEPDKLIALRDELKLFALLEKVRSEYAILPVEEFAALLGVGSQESLRPVRSVPRWRRARPPTLPTGKPHAVPAASV